jgi:UrcA family protein
MNTSTPNTSKSAFRPVLVWIVSLLGTATLALILSLLDITPAWSATPDVRSVTVSYRDLDLSTPHGAKVLYRRILAAAKEVCGYRGPGLLEQSVWKGCYHNAIADAVGKVNNPLVTAVHTGRPAAKTPMLAKTPESPVGRSPGSSNL